VFVQLFLTVCWLSTVRLSVAESKRLPTDPSSLLMDAADSVLFHRQQSTWNLDSDTQKIPTLKNNLVINDNNPVSANDFSSVTGKPIKECVTDNNNNNCSIENW